MRETCVPKSLRCSPRPRKSEDRVLSFLIFSVNDKSPSLLLSSFKWHVAKAQQTKAIIIIITTTIIMPIMIIS